MPRTPESFVRSRQEAWIRLEELVERASTGRLTQLSSDELDELGRLYRRTSSDLARAQTRYGATLAGRELARSLNALVSRAHALIYSAPQTSGAGSGPLDWLLHGFPRALRRQWAIIALAALMLYGPALIAYFAVWIEPERAYSLVPPGAVEEVEARARQKLITGWGANTSYTGLHESPLIGAGITTNNIGVSITVVAAGVTAGLGTAYILAINGILLGALAAVASNQNVDYLFWSVILPHGIIELSAICIAGGAGLLLGRALWAPGELSRRDALRLAGADAAQLLVGVAALLVIAGIIESYITPTTLPPSFKLGFSALTAILLLLYLMPRRAGRDGLAPAKAAPRPRIAAQ